jgi:hypothetical protein
MFCYVPNWRCDQMKSEWGGWGTQHTGEKKNANKGLDGKREENQNILDFKLPPCPECCVPTFRNTLSVPSSSTRNYLPMKMEQSVPKRRHIKFRRWGITQKKAYNKTKTLRRPLGGWMG